MTSLYDQSAGQALSLPDRVLETDDRNRWFH